ncbi:serine protease 55-like [Corvus hawaiiensis]|uniref:serine protease 55-like n=1 Tax=Corvus hawaiiensis TaxID=134902 RepID=UPI0020197547|nr:serine protease 55-like [Corvus hawaiiensis]
MSRCCDVTLGCVDMECRRCPEVSAEASLLRELWNSVGPGWIEMLLLTLSCLACLTSSVQAGFVSQHSQLRGDAGYSHVGCGLRPSYESFQKTGKRIGTGTHVKPGEFPWHVSIQSHGKHICGGTIISALWILTAAHCFAEELPADLTVAVGGVDLSRPLEEHNPDSLILHEEFNRTSLQNDIALILLSNPIEFSKEKIPICLPFMCDMDTWQHCWAAGWENTSAASHVLQKTQMKLISREKCLEQIPHLVGSVMCAETEQGGGGGCQVDGGGPLVCSYWDTMKWFQVGIVSGGNPNHRILTSVYSYQGWIEKETAIRGKPFFTEGVDSGSHLRVARSRAGTRMVFLEYCLILFISLIAIKLP